LTLELVEAAFEDLASADLVGQQRLYPPERLSDGVVLLLQPLQAPVDLRELTTCAST